MKRISICLLFVIPLLPGLIGCRAKKENPVVPKQVLKIAHEQEFLTLDPQKKNDSVTWSVIGNIYEPLIEFDQNMKIVAHLAERWENPNDYTWRFFLRKDVSFHNGKRFAAEDAVYTIKRGMREDSSGTKPYLISVKEVNYVDAHTFDIITERPNPLLLNRLTFMFILPSDEHPEKDIAQPIGTGPYIFDRKIDSFHILMRANPKYWAGKPAIERVEFLSYPTEEQLVDALLKDQVQVIRSFSEPLLPKVQAAENCVIMTQDALSVTFLGFNLTGNPKQNPFLNPDVRKGIYHALDTNEIVTQTLGGKATLAKQLVAPTVFGFNPNYVAPPRDPEKAKQLLAQAGFPSGFSTDIYGADAPRLHELANQLARAGIQAQPHLVEWNYLYDKVLAHELPLYTLGWSCSTGDASDFLDSCIHTPKEGTGYGNFNLASYNNPVVDILIEMSGQTLKTAERKELLQKALVAVMADLPYIPLYSRYNHYGVSKALSWEPRRDGRLYAFGMRWKEVE